MPTNTKPSNKNPQLPSGTVTRLTPKQIEALWIKAGGSKAAAPLMASIAIAESGGRPGALNNNPNTKDYSAGLWQINYYGSLSPSRTARYGPVTSLYGNSMQAAYNNAKAAVDLYSNGRGLGNWQGDAAYKAYMGGGGAALAPFLGYKPTGIPSPLQTALANQKPSGPLAGPINTVLSPIIGAGNAILHPLSWVDKILYAFAVLGGGFVTIFGLVLVAADIGLSTRAGKVAAAVPIGRAIAKKSRPPASDNRSEERAEELHRSRLAESEARVKKAQAQATESRTRQKNRRRTQKEQEEAEKKAYYRGATDAASPTMYRIKKGKKK